MKKLKKEHKVIQIWKHEYDQLYKADERFKSLVDKLYSNIEPIKPREALYGGRTNTVKHYHEINGNEEIKYINICSLYPFICKYGVFPIGHPAIYSKEQIDLTKLRDYQGLIKCQILLPTHLYLPILPYRCNGKLLFPLCGTCAKQRNKESCDHNEQ